MDRITYIEAVDIYERLQSLEERVASIKECVSDINRNCSPLAFIKIAELVNSGDMSLRQDIIDLLKKLQKKYENEIEDIKNGIQ